MKTPNINTILRNGPQRSGMGERNYADNVTGLLLQRVQFVDGDYSASGVYWGGGSRSLPLWCAFDGEEGGARVYVRAMTRAKAIEAVRAEYPAVTFKRA